MKIAYKNNSCPSPEEFDKVLSGKSSFDVELKFHNHLRECAFCNDAYEGYRIAGVSSISVINSINKVNNKFLLKRIAFAATIAILVGGYFFLDMLDANTTDEFLNETTEVVYSYGTKTLTKNTNSYFAINENGQISLNDRVIMEADIDDLVFEKGEKVYVNVFSEEKELPIRVIEKLRQKQLAVLIY